MTNVWAYCAADWAQATRGAGGVKPLVCPSKEAEVLTPHLVKASRADIVYLNLHGFADQPHYYGQADKKIGPTALTAEQVSARRWDGVVVFAEVCFSAADGGGPIAQAFLANGAKAFIGSTTEAYGRVRSTLWDGEADKLMRLFRHFYRVDRSPRTALLRAKKLLRLTSYPLDADDEATLRSFVCLLPNEDKKQ
jgi:hypothetical protein